jgi:undecaprenyl-diphosphatase
MPFLDTIAKKIEFSVLLAAIVIAGGLYGFVEMAEVARDAAPHTFDTSILLALREPGNPAVGIGPFWLPDAVRDITALGSGVVLVFVVAATIIFLIVEKQALAALFVFLAVAGGQVVSSLLKLGIDRPRPDVVPHLAEVHTLSFPSGHAMLSAVTYLTLGAMLARVTPNRAVKIYLLALAVLLTFMVGASRVYLGVHWPSDVLAGWCAGATWAMGCWVIAQWVMRRRKAGLSND